MQTTANHSHPLLSLASPLPIDKQLLSIQEAAMVLGKSMDTITRYCKRGTLLSQPISYGKKQTFLIPRQAVLIYLQEQAQKEKLVQQTQQPELVIKTKEHQSYKNKFQRAMESGLINGRPYSKRTIDDYMYYLNLYFSKYDEVSAENLENELLNTPANQKAKKVHYYKSLLCFARYLFSKKLLEEQVVKEIHQLKPRENKNPKRHVITLDEVVKLDEVCKTVEERFLFRLLVSTGIRVAEACALNWENIDLKKAKIVIEKGKGDKRREVAIPSKALGAFDAYYALKNPQSLDSPVLINRDGNRMTNRGVHDRLQRLGVKAGISKVHPHALRRAFVTINSNQGIP